MLADPTFKEEAAAAGRITIMVNNSKEVCCVHKADGIGLTPEQFLRCVRLAGAQAEEATAETAAVEEVADTAVVEACC